MRLAATLVLRDNVDVVEANILYHLTQGVDVFLATDNGSRDGTLEVLTRYEERGIVHLFEEAADSFDQARWATGMARLAASEHGADWVVNLDADELWSPQVGSLKDVLAAVPPAFGLVVCGRTNFVPRPDDGRHPFARMTLRETRSFNQKEQRIGPKTAHRAHPEVEVSSGCHYAAASGLVPLPRGNPIHVFHYPIRSYAQFEARIRNVAGILHGDPDRPADNVTRAWRRGYRNLLNGTLGEFYEEHVVDEPAAREGIAQGRLVIDRRAATFLRDHDLLSGETDPLAARLSGEPR